MSEQPIQVIKGRAPTEEEKQLVKLFDDIEADQLDLLDQSGKRIVELTGVLLGVLISIFALGDNFPPLYLVTDQVAQVLLAAGLIFNLCAMFFGLLTVNPREYARYRNNLTKMREVIEKMLDFKITMLRVAGIFFFSGMLCLVGLMLTLIF